MKKDEKIKKQSFRVRFYEKFLKAKILCVCLFLKTTFQKKLSIAKNPFFLCEKATFSKEKFLKYDQISFFWLGPHHSIPNSKSLLLV